MKNAKSFLAGFLVSALLFTGSMAVAAEVKDATISATLLNTFTLMLNGQPWHPVDSKGIAFVPIKYNGSIYMPLRAVVQEAAVMALEYDGTNKIVWVGGKTGIVKIQAADQYTDRYGTVLTTDTGILPKTTGGTWAWGVTNTKPIDMQVFGGDFAPLGKFNNFRTTIQLDASALAPMVFELRKNDYLGEVLKSVTLAPGQSEVIDVDISGLNKITLLTTATIQHGPVAKIVYGDPIFYNGTFQPDGTVTAPTGTDVIR